MNEPNQVPLIEQRWHDTLRQAKSTRFCKIYGHSKKTDGPNAEFYEEINVPFKSDKVRYYYRGELWYCANPNCEWKKFSGEKAFYRVTIIKGGVEYEAMVDETGPGAGPEVQAQGQ